MKQAYFLLGTDDYANSNFATMYGSEGAFSEVISYPNPFNPESAFTNIYYYLTKPASIDAWIYTHRGKMVFRHQSTQQVGKKILSWSGRDLSGDIVPNGVYRLTISATANGEKTTQRHLISVLR